VEHKCQTRQIVGNSPTLVVGEGLTNLKVGGISYLLG
jgi:hypothetical protein